MSIQSINPATGETIETFQETTPAELERILTGAQAAVGHEQEVAGVAIDVDQPAGVHHPIPGPQDLAAKLVAQLLRGVRREELIEVQPFQVLHGQDPGRAVLGVDARHDDLAVAREVAVELLGVPPFHAVVELLPDRAGEVVHERDRVDERERAYAVADAAGDLVQEPKVGFDLPRRSGGTSTSSATS